MRVISGGARGTKLYSLEGLDTRPTLDRVKESLFNIIMSKIPDSQVLDLFAGSGAIGIECASRGAKKVVFCDKSKRAIDIINKNLNKTNLIDKSVVVNSDFKALLNTTKNKFDLIFIDPPYATNLAIESVQEIIKLNLISSEGTIILETDDEVKLIKQIEKLNCEIEICDIRKYGRVKLIFIKRKG